MKREKHWFLKYPLVPAFVLPLLGILLISVMTAFLYPLFAAGFPLLTLSAQDAENALSSIGRCIFALIVVLVMKKSSDGAFCFGFGKKNLTQSIVLSLFGMAHIALTVFEGCLFSEGFRSTVGGVLTAILLGLGAGLFEETVCRGVVLSNMMDKWREKKQRILLSVLLSSIVFGLLHLLSLSGNSVLWVLLQIFVASGLGAFLARYMCVPATSVVPSSCICLWIRFTSCLFSQLRLPQRIIL